MPEVTDIETRLRDYGEVEVVEGPFVGAPLKAGDYFAHSYDGGGGYGDPLEREPALVLDDLEDGKISLSAAKQHFKVVASYNEETHTFACDTAQTNALRAAERTSRLQKAVPVSQWMNQQKERMTQHPSANSTHHQFALEVREMYNDCFGNSPTWHKEFVDFWDLPEDFRF